MLCAAPFAKITALDLHLQYNAS